MSFSVNLGNTTYILHRHILPDFRLLEKWYQKDKCLLVGGKSSCRRGRGCSRRGRRNGRRHRRGRCTRGSTRRCLPRIRSFCTLSRTENRRPLNSSAQVRARRLFWTSCYAACSAFYRAARDWNRCRNRPSKLNRSVSLWYSIHAHWEGLVVGNRKITPILKFIFSKLVKVYFF